MSDTPQLTSGDLEATSVEAPVEAPDRTGGEDREYRPLGPGADGR